MNRPVIACSAWLLLASVPLVAHERPVSRGPVFDRASMQLDLDTWVSELEAAHPDPYTRISREAFQARVRDARARLPETLDPLQYFAVMQSLASALRDAHTRFHLPRASAAYGKDSFPLEIWVHEGRAFVAQPRADIARGCEITRINGVPTARILDSARSLASDDIVASDALVAMLFWPAVWLERARAPFRVEGLSTRRKPIDVVLDGSIPVWVPPKRPDYRLEWLDGRVAYLAIDDMVDVPGFGLFVQDAFSKIDQKKAKGLVVDLRRNGGGSTEVADMLLARITDKPYRIFAEKHWRVSARQRAQLAGAPWLDSDYLAAPTGTTLHHRYPPYRAQRVTPVFRGPVCVLIGPETGSSAMMLANAIKDYQLATLIGEPTSSPPNYFSHYLTFDLPHTLLGADVSTARFVRANGEAANTEPVMPDIVVHQSIQEWLRGDDPVLPRALTWIATRR